MLPSADYEQVEFYFNCRNLKDLDFVGKSDPQCKVYLKSKEGQWGLLGQTEMQKDNLNPDFVKTVLVDFIFETNQELKIEVWDIDETTANDLIGSAETSVGAIMGSRKQTVILDLKNKSKKNTGKLTIRGERVGASKNMIYWQWSGVKLMNVDGWFGKSDPFLRFFKIKPQGDTLLVHETEFIKNNCDPVWKLCKISEDRLCGANPNQPFRIECWDDQEDKNFRYIGTVDITLAQVLGGQKDFTLHNAKKNKSAGTLRILSFTLQEKYSLIDYLKAGTQLSLIGAVDFTGSNGDPKNPTSLHAIKQDGSMNEYQKALFAVGQILLNYDYDQQIPIYGFGGKPAFPGFNAGQVSHCFPCSGNVQNAQVMGLDGIMQVYQYALQHVALSGPTYFAPIITEAVKVAQSNKQANNGVYSILLILTDGEIHDMEQTVDLIVESAYLPISIIIVGVGQANFDKMRVLDGDNGLVSSSGKKSVRDYVQFVSFRDFTDISALSRNVLAEVPDQVCNYFELIGFKPKTK